MALVKSINIEFGASFMIADIKLSNNTGAKVIGTVDEDAKVSWLSESPERLEATEDKCLSVAKAVFNAMLHEATGD